MAKKNWRFLSLAVFVLCFIFAVPAVHAIEPGSLPHYTGGNEDFFAGALPPAGTQVYLNYFLDYQMTGFNGNNRDTKVIPGLGRESFAGQAVVNAFRYVSVTKHKALGGDIVWHIIVPVVYAHIAAAAGGLDLAHGSETSIGDVEFGVGIAWHHSPTLHSVFGVDIVAPTGQYSPTDTLSVGTHYWSFNPLYAITYIGDKSSPLPGFEASAKFDYWFNTVNTETHYTSGQQFDFDYLLAQHFCKNWAFGANGHFLYQTTNDKSGYLNPNWWNASSQPAGPSPVWSNIDAISVRYFSVGPAITYELPNHGCITFKWQNDIMAQNMPTGNHFWLKFIWPF